MRLIAGTARGQGRYAAAAEIKLAGAAVTYWRQPGDAGVPPTFSFQGSTNLATAEVAYPAPLRINEQGLEAFGYRGDVAFPIAVTARDPAKPVHLRLTLNYAVCDNICLPAKSVTELELPQTGASDAEQTHRPGRGARASSAHKSRGCAKICDHARSGRGAADVVSRLERPRAKGRFRRSAQWLGHRNASAFGAAFFTGRSFNSPCKVFRRVSQRN